MTRLSALLLLLPVLATLAEASPIKHPRSHTRPRARSQSLAHLRSRSATVHTGKRSTLKKCHRKSKKPEWNEYAANHQQEGDAWKQWTGKHKEADSSAVTENGDMQQENATETVTQDASSTVTTEQAPTPTPAPSPEPTPASSEGPAPEPTTNAEPAPEPTPNSDTTEYPCTEGTGEHAGECLRNIPVPHPRLKPMPTWPTGKSQQAWIDAHNLARAQFGVGTVGWSEGAYAQAKANVEGHAADGCKMEHTKDGKFGENLYMASWDAGVDVGMGMWMGEAKNFNWSDPNHQTAPLGDWGHFTPIVWRDMTEIGCATATCSSGATIGACCYNGGVNMGGQYEKMVPEPI